MSSGPPDEATADVVVLGGGPAGSAAAALLSRWGHRVTLVTRPVPPAPALAQSIPPSARKLLGEVGALETVESADFPPNAGNTIWWAERPVRREVFGADAAGWHVERAGLEAALLPWTRGAGVRLRLAQAHGVNEDGDGWRIANGAEGGELRARWLLDATGRAGVVARREGRVTDVGTRTLALVRDWRRADGWPGAAPGHTLVESYEAGWVWSLPRPEGARCVTVMVDPEHCDVGESDPTEAYERELARCTHVRELLEDASPDGPAWACPATLYTARSFGRPGLLLVGDAGSFIDPLSSYGVKKALASAWLAAVVTHTALSEPEMTEASLELFDANEHEVYRTYRALSVDFFEEAAGAYGHPFWAVRAEAARAAAADTLPRTDPADRPPGAGALEALPAEPEVRAAFEAIRSAETLDARPADSLRTVRRPAVDGNRVVLLDHLASDASPVGLRWARGVDLVALVDEAPRHARVPDVWEAYCRRAGDVPLPDFLSALATAFAAGFLER